MTRQIGISPKLIAAVFAALIAHVLADPVLELPAWADYALQAVLTGLGAFLAPPGQTATDYRADDIRPKTKPRPKRKPQAGLSSVEAVVIVFVVIAILVLVGVDLNGRD